MLSAKPYRHDSTFTPPKVKRLKTHDLRAYHRRLKLLRESRVMPALRHDVALVLLQKVGWQGKEQVSQIVLGAESGNASVKTVGRTVDDLVTLGLLKVHHIITRGARGGGVVQDVNIYELVAPAEPDGQTDNESLSNDLRATLLVGKAGKAARRVCRAVRGMAMLSPAEEDERARASAARQIAMLTGQSSPG